ncbi:MAG: 30S ribosomal protein S20 [Bacillota bacterium]
MPNIKSAIKRVELIRKRTAINTARKSAMRTAIKRFEQSLTTDKPEVARIQLQKAIKTIDTMSQKGLIHKNNAARKKSSLQKKFNRVISSQEGQ